MNIILFDHPETRASLMPFTLTRPVCEIRMGIGTIREKWEWMTGGKVTCLTQDYLKEKYPTQLALENYFIDGSILPDKSFFQQISELASEHCLISSGRILAARTRLTDPALWSQLSFTEVSIPTSIDRLWKIFQLNGEEIRKDFDFLTKGRTSQIVTDPFTRIYNPDQVFIEEGVRVKAAIINAESGPVYLGRNSEVLEGAIVRGPFALGEGARLSMGAIIRGDTTIGPYCRVGGEINNSVFFSHSNKAHDGFLGNAVIGSWCNLGAGTTASNLKNNFKTIRLWNGNSKELESTGLQFCGLMMGDYTTSAINTSFNTATWVGCGARVIGSEFPPSVIPPFVQGGATGFKELTLNEVIESVRRFYELKKATFTSADKNLLEQLHALTLEFRN